MRGRAMRIALALLAIVLGTLCAPMPAYAGQWLGGSPSTYSYDGSESNCQYLWIDLGHAAVSTDGLTAC
jgi:hypothetical protein